MPPGDTPTPPAAPAGHLEPNTGDETMTMTENVTVREIGFFAAGSFGVPGMPVDGCELYRVDCPELREATAAAHPAMPDYGPYTFSTRRAAEIAAERQVEREERRAAERQAADDQRRAESERRSTVGRQIADLIERAVGPVTELLVWTDRLASDLSAGTIASINAMPGPGGGDYDCRIGERLYRVRLPHPYAGGGSVVEITPA